MIKKMQPSIAINSTTRARDPIVMCAADDAYVIPLAVTLTSAAQHLSPGNRLRVYLVDAGIQEANWHGLRESLAREPVEIVRIPANVARLQHLKTSHHISHTAFIRLLAAQWLPASLDRVIYLDSDLLFRDDLSQLWGLDLGGAYCAAVPDIACPYIDARFAHCNFRRSAPYMATLNPIRNWRQFGLNPGAHYFNSGLMLIDLVAWRENSLGDRFLKCLADHPRDVWCWDQYALNVVLANHWKRLPLRWNQGTHAFEYPSLRHSPVLADDFREMIERPAVIHFTTEFKPWSYGSRHPQRKDYFAALQGTAWRDWQPAKPAVSLRRACQFAGAGLAKRATIAVRKWKGLFYRQPNSVRATRLPAPLDPIPSAAAESISVPE